MEYYWLAPLDQRHNNYILHEECVDAQERRRLRLRKSYRSMACEGCGKIDEDVAIRQGISPAVSIQSSADFLSSTDNIICISGRLKKFIREHDIGGLEFAPLPGDCNYFAVLPTREVETDVNRCGMRFVSPCDVCGRFRETCFLPALESIQLPASHLWMVCPAIRSESVLGRDYWYLASQEVFRALMEQQFTGIDFHIKPA